MKKLLDWIKLASTAFQSTGDTCSWAVNINILRVIDEKDSSGPRGRSILPEISKSRVWAWESVCLFRAVWEICLDSKHGINNRAMS